MPYNGDTTERNDRRQLIVAGGFFLLSVIAANLPAGAQQPIAAGLRLTLLQPFVAMQRAVTGARLRSAEVAELRTRLDSMIAVLSTTRSLAEENDRLRRLLDLGERVGPEFRAASVTRSGTPGSESVFLLDVGSEHGVRVGAPVLVREGLIGKVIEVRDRESIAMDWTHPDFRASAMTRDGTVFGMVEPDRATFREADRLLLNGIAFYSELEPGTAVVTSGRGGVFPRGVAIGAVVELERADPRWRRSYLLRPATRPGAALHVLVAVGGRAGTLDLTEAFAAATDSAVETPPVESQAAPIDTVPGSPTEEGLPAPVPAGPAGDLVGDTLRPAPGDSAGVGR